MGRRVHFAYDLAGREVRYSYDAQGNVTALTPPGWPVHRFDYTPLDQEAQYTPPEVGAGDPATRYTYNRDRQLTRLTRPDGQTVALPYDAGGKLEALQTPHGTYRYADEPTTGQHRMITAPDAAPSSSPLTASSPPAPPK